MAMRGIGRVLIGGLLLVLPVQYPLSAGVQSPRSTAPHTVGSRITRPLAPVTGRLNPLTDGTAQAWHAIDPLALAKAKLDANSSCGVDAHACPDSHPNPNSDACPDSNADTDAHAHAWIRPHGRFNLGGLEGDRESDAPGAA
jgi:hypothetical protein